MDYLAQLDLSAVSNDIGIGEAIYVFLESCDTTISLGEAPTVKVILYGKTADIPDGDLVYDPLDPTRDARFSSAPWAPYFQIYSEAYVNLETTKEILRYCSRLSQLKTFW